MPLAACPVCRGQVSTSAVTCPHCGHWLVPAPPGAPDQIRPGASGVTLLQFGSGAAVAVGSFLPWATALGGLIEKRGTDGDGIITLVAGVVMLAAAFMYLNSSSRASRVIFGIGSAVAAGVGVIDVIDVAGTDGISIGYGLWLVLLGGFAGVVAAFVSRESESA
jgi:hypothetical protein